MPSKQLHPILRPLLIVVAFFAIGACSDSRSKRTPVVSEVSRREGEVLIGRFACAACHIPEPEIAERVAPSPGPRLEAIGQRANARWMRDYLTDPHGVKPGTAMPDVLSHLGEQEKTETIEDLVHFLQSRGGPFVGGRQEVLAMDFAAGERLFDTVGCLACHSSGMSVDLASKTSLPALAEFLEDPLAHRPDGRMPDLNLSSREARAIAAHLLHDQQQPHRDVHVGLVTTWFEGDFDPDDATLSKAKTVKRSSRNNFDISPRNRDDNFGFRFDGSINLPRAGSWTFFTSSDDGSWLDIAGARVVNNAGLHGTQERAGTMALLAGRHPISVTMFERKGGEALEVKIEGPDFEKARIPDAWLDHEFNALDAPADALVPDQQRVGRGQEAFRTLGC
ncbi:MAG: PA14 domain-containing protein, partial [Myxococcota bacterium]